MDETDETDWADWRGAGDREVDVTVLLGVVALGAAGGGGFGARVELDGVSVRREGSKWVVFMTVRRRSALVVAIVGATGYSDAIRAGVSSYLVKVNGKVKECSDA